MANEALKLHLSSALSGYAGGQIRLEDVVDSVGYAPVMDSLIDLSVTESQPDMNVPTAAFLNALSPKSKGLMLTSALLSDNERLYKPLHSDICNHLGEMYAQDLTSLLGGEHARDGLVEMTRRACHDSGSLEHLNTGFSRICASVYPSGLLENTKTEIAESRWVEKNRAESRDFLTMVSAAPEAMDVQSLKTKPLTLFLSKGLKLGVVAVVAAAFGAGLTMTGIYASGFANTASGFGAVNLKERPTIETVISKDKVAERKIVQYGEFDGIKLVEKYANNQINRTLKGTIASFTADRIVGRAEITKPGEASDEALCIVSHHQTAPVTQDGNFYKFSNLPGVIVDKNLWNFLVTSHETGHCFFQIDNSNGGARELDQFEQAYETSLEEVYGDLVASLDYMRETGTNALYTDFLRPMRMSTVEDVEHQTAWALDEIFTQIDPAAIHLKSKEEIPQIAKFLIEKNFMAKDGSYYPGNMHNRAVESQSSPAVRALWSELIASWKTHHQRYADPLVVKLSTDIQTTMSQHYAKYTGVAPQEAIDSAMAGYKELAATYKLKPVETVQVAKAQVSKPLDSLLSAYL